MGAWPALFCAHTPICNYVTAEYAGLRKTSSRLDTLAGPVLSLIGKGSGSAKNIGPIGFEISHEHLHMVQMEKAGSIIRIRAAVSQPYSGGRQSLLESPKALRKLVRSALRGRHFRGKKIVTCVPSEQLKLMMINYSCGKNDNEAEMLLDASLARVGGDIDEWIVDYLPIRAKVNSDTDRVALVAMAQQTEQLAFLTTLHKAGFHVDALEIGPVSIRRLVISLPSEKQYPINLVVNFGRSSSYITVYSGERLLIDRAIQFGEQEAIERLSRELELDLESATKTLYQYGVMAVPAVAANSDIEIGAHEISKTLAEILKPMFLDLMAEVRKVLIYVASQSRGASIDAVYLLGSAARWPGTAPALEEFLNLPVEVLNPFCAFEANSDPAVLRGLDPVAGIATAIGCALRDL